MQVRANAGRKAVTLIEVLVAVAIVALLAGLVLPKMSESKAASDLVVARGQAVTLQTALDSWLSNASSLNSARVAFNSSGAADLPENTGTFLALLAQYLDTGTQANFTTDADDATGTHIVTPNMKERGWYMRIIWTGATWRTVHPRVELNITDP